MGNFQELPFRLRPVTQGRLEPVYPVEAAKGQVYHLSFPLRDILISCGLHTSSEPIPSSFQPHLLMRKRGTIKLPDPTLPEGVNAAGNQRGAVSLSRTYTRVSKQGQDNLKHGSSSKLFLFCTKGRRLQEPDPARRLFVVLTALLCSPDAQ